MTLDVIEEPVPRTYSAQLAVDRVVYELEVSDYDHPDDMPAVEEMVTGWDQVRARVLELITAWTQDREGVVVTAAPGWANPSPRHGMSLLLTSPAGYGNQKRHQISLHPQVNDSND